jgi:hypothetical protein
MHFRRNMCVSLSSVTCVQSVFRTYKYLDSYVRGMSRNTYAVGVHVNYLLYFPIKNCNMSTNF